MATAVIPPPFTITANDKRGLIVVTVALVLAFVWLCSLIRIWLRIQGRDWKVDDWLLATATLVHTAQSGIILHLVDLGLGLSRDAISAEQAEQFGKEAIASQIFYICTLLLSKCSVLFLYVRLSPGGAHKVMTFATLGASFVWAILAIILIVVPCNPTQYYTHPEKCTNRWSKWQAIGSLDIITEAFIFGIACQMVWSLQMKLKSKIFVVVAFSARLPVIAIAGTRLYYLHRHFLGKTVTFEYLVATQWQMGYAIMSSTITGMGPFIRPFNKEYQSSYAKSKFGYGHSSSRGPDTLRSTRASAVPQRASWQSEGYLMESIPSSRGSRVTTSDGPEMNTIEESSATDAPATSTTPVPATSHVPNILKADANFRPIDDVTRTDWEVWVGDRTMSFGGDEDMNPKRKEDRGLVINKRTQVKIEVDRASCVI
ncbi:hypothetical protein HBI56_150370 [Parastagonospora nodorum]|uniref:Rhodopsin domain-containing protein n=1 Tax=Phaeosphaeria nodorum (strain SN15 / ATCC MYA-4574 / FGSC 10173) TaxID=321614 RepID=A0A7U2I5F5_PHANO|nr:hypothetical protein HBH56_184160 [Parastagonospora nodorum]QRD04086.1 hypothetical protein JI435_128250 [Parastagonospora nodorum SN15]KAH3925994.1 hypothetical protein HBH54_173310 [Parastagonospora nodorum]KAH3962402.1 hypothetical protein HBH52_224790 [Parastagonospora nodorum]KAH3964934.1 hypothetical protein HBH51_155780 [Parastagonospora nodorum]